MGRSTVVVVSGNTPSWPIAFARRSSSLGLPRLKRLDNYARTQFNSIVKTTRSRERSAARDDTGDIKTLNKGHHAIIGTFIYGAMIPRITRTRWTFKVITFVYVNKYFRVYREARPLAQAHMRKGSLRFAVGSEKALRGLCRNLSHDSVVDEV
jgi:hypothetical protein